MNLKTISLIISLSGISLLLLLSLTPEPELSSIQDLKTKQIYEKVKIQGQVINQRSYNNDTFNILQIKDSTGKIDVLLEKKLSLNQNQTLIVIGKITEFQNNIQIIADEIR
ncbi:MAG: OB-fold nucleic acid binding domain-containing protein [Nanoarchaeota archaeon]